MSLHLNMDSDDGDDAPNQQRDRGDSIGERSRLLVWFHLTLDLALVLSLRQP